MGRARVLLLSLLLLVLNVCTVAAETPALRLAVLPVLDETGGWMDREDRAALQQRLQEDTRIPLNGCLQIAGYIPPEESLAALHRLEAEQLQAAGKKRLNDKLLAPRLAEALQADLVVYLRVKTYYQRIYYGYLDGPQVETIVDLRLCGYDRRAGRLIDEAALRHEEDDFTPRLAVEVVAQESLDYLLQRARLREAIFPLAAKK